MPALGVRAVESAKEPRAAERPPSLRSPGRDAQRFGRFGQVQSGEEAELDETRLVWMRGAEGYESLVEIDEVDRALRFEDRCGRVAGRVERHTRTFAPPPTQTSASSRPIDENAAHGGCGDGEEVGSIAPIHPALIDKLEIRLMNESRRLQRLIHRLASQPMLGKSTQCVVDGRQQVICGAGPIDPGVEQYCREVSVGHAWIRAERPSQGKHIRWRSCRISCRRVAADDAIRHAAAPTCGDIVF